MAEVEVPAIEKYSRMFLLMLLAVFIGVSFSIIDFSFEEGAILGQFFGEGLFPYTRNFLEEVEIFLRFFIPYVILGSVILFKKSGLFWFAWVSAFSTSSILWLFFAMSDSTGKEFISRAHYDLSPIYALLISYLLYNLARVVSRKHFFVITVFSLLCALVVFALYYAAVVYPYTEVDRVFNRTVLEDNVDYCNDLMQVPLQGRASTVTNECFWNYAQYKQDTSFCDRITVHDVSDTYIRNECFRHSKF
jgi:hypothetical protein